MRKLYLFISLVIFWQVGESISGTNVVSSVDQFKVWSQIARADNDGPTLNPDRTVEWHGPDQQKVSLKLQNPAISNPKPLRVKSDATKDASSYLQSAIESAINKKINHIILEPGEYHLLSAVNPSGAHLEIKGASDLIIDGQGAKLIFHQKQVGVRVRESKRVLIKDLVLSYAAPTRSYGTIASATEPKTLVLDSTTDKNASVTQMVEVDNQNRFVPNGQRFYFPPEFDGLNKKEGKFYFRDFKNLSYGTRFLATLDWYGPVALHISDDRSGDLSEDIHIEKVNFEDSPGMAILVRGLRRGLRVSNCRFGINGHGPSWDGIHVASAGGDLLIEDNVFEDLLDDAINLNAPIHKVLESNSDGFLVNKAVNLIKPNDKIALFSNDGEYLGITEVKNKRTAKNDTAYIEIQNQSLISPEVKFIRNTTWSNKRYTIRNNTFKNIGAHSILAQTPHGWIYGNKFMGNRNQSIRLLTSLGQWQEGVGAFNILVSDNFFKTAGVDRFPLGVNGEISIYGGIQAQKLTSKLVNDYILIKSNNFESTSNQCVFSNAVDHLANQQAC